MAKGIYINTENSGVKKAKKLWVNTGNGVKKVKKAWVCVSTDPLQVNLVYVAGYKYDSRVATGTNFTYKDSDTINGTYTQPSINDDGIITNLTGVTSIAVSSIADNPKIIYTNIVQNHLTSLSLNSFSKGNMSSFSGGSIVDGSTRLGTRTGYGFNTQTGKYALTGSYVNSCDSLWNDVSDKTAYSLENNETVVKAYRLKRQSYYERVGDLQHRNVGYESYFSEDPNPSTWSASLYANCYKAVDRLYLEDEFSVALNGSDDGATTVSGYFPYPGSTTAQYGYYLYRNDAIWKVITREAYIPIETGYEYNYETASESRNVIFSEFTQEVIEGE